MMWHSLTHNWNVARVIRLILGIMIAYQGVYTHQTGVILMGTFFTIFSLFTSGCCGATCSNNSMKMNKDSNEKETIIYEEIK